MDLEGLISGLNSRCASSPYFPRLLPLTRVPSVDYHLSLAFRGRARHSRDDGDADSPLSCRCSLGLWRVLFCAEVSSQDRYCTHTSFSFRSYRRESSPERRLTTPEIESYSFFLLFLRAPTLHTYLHVQHCRGRVCTTGLRRKERRNSF